jgi:hypothetical protein
MNWLGDDDWTASPADLIAPVPAEHRLLASALIAPRKRVWTVQQAFPAGQRDAAEARLERGLRSWPKKYGNDPAHWRLVELPDGTLQVQHYSLWPALPTVFQAERIARLAHALQVDQAGAGYIDHPRRVAERLAAAGESEAVVAAGWLHDTLEDTWVTPRFLYQAGIGSLTVGLVEAVTKRPGESAQGYVTRIVAHRATAVKQADLADNTDPERLALLPPDRRERLEAKYARLTELLAATEARRDTWEFAVEVDRSLGGRATQEQLRIWGDSPAEAILSLLADNDGFFMP